MDFTQISTPRSRFTHEKAYENFSRSAVFFRRSFCHCFAFVPTEAFSPSSMDGIMRLTGVFNFVRNIARRVGMKCCID